MLDLRDRVVVLTGASSGIGRELARRLARLEELREEIRTEGGSVPLVARCDVGDAEQVEALRKRVEEEFGGIEEPYFNNFPISFARLPGNQPSQGESYLLAVSGGTFPGPPGRSLP